jgi:hypothetical protein
MSSTQQSKTAAAPAVAHWQWLAAQARAAIALLTTVDDVV